MSVVLTIRDVPEAVRDELAREARDRGQSLQAYLLGLLARQASFAQNRQIIVEVEERLHGGGGAGANAPHAADVLAEARARGRSGPAPS